ncbi:glycosyltransferase family 2 protein [Paenibacillus doosanensis]|uniref:glycosyltransferase family A protein n=1 Tax=Paenibacillus doosanensis TaxID=1229154 RepID=UPI00217F870C|nr:glycosyltransferase family A protein [Paenibacillus doosanensis]MCS7459960.1 glycosyltransferase family 2 protein [Paenibacillus doosanensis]
MMVGLLWIFGCYGASIALVHWCYRRHRDTGRNVTHVLLLTHNNQNQVEWYIRSLLFFSRLKGREVHVTLADEGSTDDTLAIAERFRLEYHLDIRRFSDLESLDDWIREHEEKQVVIVRLGQQDGLVTAYKAM